MTTGSAGNDRALPDPPNARPQRSGNAGLVDVLDRVLDKGLVVAGDIRIALADVELLTIRVRLLVCSIDKAEQIGLDWWRHDPALTSRARGLEDENARLRRELRKLSPQRAGELGLNDESEKADARETKNGS